MSMIKAVLPGMFAAAIVSTGALAAEPSAATAETRYIEIKGDRIAYRTIGKGSPLVLASRMRGTLDTWDPLFLDELAKSHLVITFDYPGVGYSGGKLPSEMGLVAAFIGDLATALKLEKFALLGWSWGGFAAQALLVDQPGRVTHAILVGTNPPGQNQFPVGQVFLERALKPVNDLADEEVLFFEPRSEVSRKAAKASHDRIYARPGVEARIPSTMPEFAVYINAHKGFREDATARREKLTATRTPLLLLCGDNDTSNPVQNWFPLNGRLPNAQLIVYSECGHAPQHQHPELSAYYIAGFLKQAQP